MNRRDLLTNLGSAGALAAAAPLLEPERSYAATGSGAVTGSESAKLFLPPDHLAPATEDRLPLEWSKQRTRVLQARLEAAGYDGIYLTDQWNIIYFTGLWHTDTERLFHAFIPTKGDHPIWFYPALDRDLVHSWWYQDGDMYFDWLDVAGAAPQEGKVVKGPTQDQWLWALEGLKRRGFAGKKLAADKELVPSAQKTVVDVLKNPMASAADDCLYLRERKTPEELALCRRAYGYFDRIHAYARDLILTHGTDLTDFDVGSAATKFGTDMILSEIKHDGGPHTAVGITIDVSCRAGRTTGYPHPNQFLYNKIARGQALQVEGMVTIGGCGGELYRPFMIAPRTPHMEKIWTVNRDCCLMQKDLSRKGTQCSDVAFPIHEYQVKQGVQKYIYHRPAHGEGMEGHQPPYISLGDHTVLDTGMCFSVEPGLFDPQGGIGSNFSDVFTVEPQGPSLQMSRLPWSEEWMWIKI
jgi:Xaa-Pro aminopeptidase